MANSASMQTGPLVICSESRIACQRGVRGCLRSPITISYRASVSSGPAWQSACNSCRGVDDAHDWSRRWLGCEPPPGADWTKGRGVPRAGFSAELGILRLTSPTLGSDVSFLARLGFALASVSSRGLRVSRAIQISSLLPLRISP